MQCECERASSAARVRVTAYMTEMIGVRTNDTASRARYKVTVVAQTSPPQDVIGVCVTAFPRLLQMLIELVGDFVFGALGACGPALGVQHLANVTSETRPGRSDHDGKHLSIVQVSFLSLLLP